MEQLMPISANKHPISCMYTDGSILVFSSICMKGKDAGVYLNVMRQDGSVLAQQVEFQNHIQSLVICSTSVQYKDFTVILAAENEGKSTIGMYYYRDNVIAKVFHKTNWWENRHINGMLCAHDNVYIFGKVVNHKYEGGEQRDCSNTVSRIYYGNM